MIVKKLRRINKKVEKNQYYSSVDNNIENFKVDRIATTHIPNMKNRGVNSNDEESHFHWNLPRSPRLEPVE